MNSKIEDHGHGKCGVRDLFEMLRNITGFVDESMCLSVTSLHDIFRHSIMLFIFLDLDSEISALPTIVRNHTASPSPFRQVHPTQPLPAPDGLSAEPTRLSAGPCFDLRIS